MNHIIPEKASKNILRLNDQVSFVTSDGRYYIGNLATFESGDMVKVLVGQKIFDIGISELCFLNDAALWRNLAHVLAKALKDEAVQQGLATLPASLSILDRVTAAGLLDGDNI